MPLLLSSPGEERDGVRPKGETAVVSAVVEVGVGVGVREAVSSSSPGGAWEGGGVGGVPSRRTYS